MQTPSLRRLKEHWPAVFITGLFMLLAAAYSVIVPLFESPDELWHYPFVWHLARTAELPIQDPANPQLWRQEGSQPPLYYILAALLTAAIPADDLPALIYPNPHADIGLISPDGNANIVVHTGREAWPWSGAVLAIHLARLFSTLLGTGTILCSYALGRLLWPEQRRLAILTMGFIAFNPMFIFISGSVNNDNLVTLLASLALWQLVVIVIDASSGNADHAGEPSPWRFAGLGIVVGLAALTKVSGLGLLGLVNLVLFSYGLKYRRWRVTFLGPSLVTLIALGVAGWWYWRNQSLYDDWTGVETMVLMMGGRPVPPTIEQIVSEIPGLFRSFWGVFGYFSVSMPAPVYWLLNSILLAGLLGLGGALLPWPRLRPLPERFRQTWPILMTWILLMVLGLLQWTMQTPATQGRLLFPALAALAVLWAGGWLVLTPSRWQLLPVATMGALSIWIPWAIIKPAYTLPAPVAALPASAQPIEVDFEGGIHLLAYETPESPMAKPGEMVPITIYWRGEQPLETDYTVFVHLVDEYGLIVAQRDIFHGPGVYPTSQWLAGQIFSDTYTLKIPYTAFAPAQVGFMVGLYDHTTGSRLFTSSGVDHVRFGQISLEPQPGDLPNPQQLLFEDGIMLVGYNLDQRRVATGEQVRLTLYWQGQAEPAKNYKVFVHLVNSQEIRAAQHDSEPANGAAPTSSWRLGQTIIDEHLLTIDPEAAPGSYQFFFGLYEGDSGRRLRLLRNHGTPVQADAVTLSGVQVAAP